MEMIITKSGRRMFPSVQINVNGLEKRENYYVFMEIAPASGRRHKYCGYQNGGKNSNMGRWSFTGSPEPQQPFGYRIYKHPESPATGSYWMDNPISFNKLKLTNINDLNNNVVLTSTDKYVPRIWIVRCFDANYNELFTHSTTLFAFKETEFIAVTAYQNENITKLKINNNPFAKGFRETGLSRFKRKHHSIDHQAQSDSSPDEGQFYENNTEMIITKSGRRMFLSVQINVSGLKKRENYYVFMEIAPASDRRNKYCGYQNGGKNSNMGGWSFTGPAEPQQLFGYRIYKHPESPATGSHWMDNPISFNKLKLTNNINDPNNNVVLTSMHKYVPRIWIVRCFDAKNYNELFTHPTALFAFKETEFIAVTAYENENITKLKINNNPFAKGFRETGQLRFKRKHHSIDYQAQSDSSPDEGVSLIYDSEYNQPNDPLLR
ncbi:T-box protein 2, partial [Temnothorax longispinosus]